MMFTESPMLVTVAIVILIEWLLPIPMRYSPLQMCRIIALALAQKVNKTDSTPQQRKVAGTLSLFTYFLIVGTLVWALLFVMPYDLVTEAVLLYLSMGFHAVSAANKNIEDALRNKQKSLARSFLTEITTVSTNRLSELGIIKTTLEESILAWLNQWLMPVVLFICFGGIASFAYALITTAINSWPILNPKFKDFAAIPHKIKTWFELPFTLVLLPLFSIFKSSPGWLKITFTNRLAWPSKSSLTELLWCSVVAAGCKIEMAGPVMFDDQKVTRVRLKAGAAPDQTALKSLRHWQHRFTVFSVLLILLFWLVANLA